jgi:hypothetical protein
LTRRKERRKKKGTKKSVVEGTFLLHTGNCGCGRKKKQRHRRQLSPKLHFSVNLKVETGFAIKQQSKIKKKERNNRRRGRTAVGDSTWGGQHATDPTGNE